MSEDKIFAKNFKEIADNFEGSVCLAYDGSGRYVAMKGREDVLLHLVAAFIYEVHEKGGRSLLDIGNDLNEAVELIRLKREA